MEKVGIHVSQVFKIDASKRSTHTNAYFTGIGKVKRIVLYDTLLKKLTHREILTILAHEAGHWKKKHVFKRIVVSEAIALLVLYISFVALQGDLLSRLFSIHENTFFAKVVVLGFIAAITAFPFGPVSNYFSRRQEQEADVFAFQFTDDAQSMASALVKLSRDNLSNLHPHPLYALFHYSHPPVVQRIRTIQGFTDDKPA
jgi:STE24 endopeptidase